MEGQAYQVLEPGVYQEFLLINAHINSGYMPRRSCSFLEGEASDQLRTQSVPLTIEMCSTMPSQNMLDKITGFITKEKRSEISFGVGLECIFIDLHFNFLFIWGWIPGHRNTNYEKQYSVRSKVQVILPANH